LAPYALSNKAKKSYERDVLTLKHFTGIVEADKLPPYSDAGTALIVKIGAK
jgi:hypothetical protein